MNNNFTILVCHCKVLLLIVSLVEQNMKITILVPKKEFDKNQQKQLSLLAKTVYTKSRNKHSLAELCRLAKDSEILAVDPDVLGGFEEAKPVLNNLMDGLPKLKALALSSTSFSWIDLDYCKKREIKISNVPYYSTEAVAEHILGLMICLAKKIIISDRKTQQGRYQLEIGTELKGKTLGIIGLGNIGGRVTELGQAIGMNIIAYNRTPKSKKGVQMKSIDEVLSQSDVLSINLAHNDKTNRIISTASIKKMKKGVIVINLATRELVDERAMAKALKKGQIASYAYEGEDLNTGPLVGIESAVGLKGFAWYTQESLKRNKQIWINNIISFVKHSSSLRLRHLPKQGSGVRNPEPNAIHPTSLHSWHSGSWVINKPLNLV